MPGVARTFQSVGGWCGCKTRAGKPVPLQSIACEQAPTVGDATVATATVMVQVPLILFLEATVMVFEPAVAVTVPPVHVPPVTLGVATRSPAGRVSVKLTAMADVLMTE